MPFADDDDDESVDCLLPLSGFVRWWCHERRRITAKGMPIANPQPAPFIAVIAIYISKEWKRLLLMVSVGASIPSILAFNREYVVVVSLSIKHSWKGVYSMTTFQPLAKHHVVSKIPTTMTSSKPADRTLYETSFAFAGHVCERAMTVWTRIGDSREKAEASSSTQQKYRIRLELSRARLA